ncbi:MAG TPA: hypothetical protein VH744_05850, partial [Terriglobales bacterium]
MLFLSLWPKPDLGPETLALNGRERGKPEDLVGRAADGGADSIDAPGGGGDHEHAETVLVKQLRKFPTDRQAEVDLNFPVPTSQGFGTLIDFDKNGANA